MHTLLSFPLGFDESTNQASFFTLFSSFAMALAEKEFAESFINQNNITLSEYWLCEVPFTLCDFRLSKMTSYQQVHKWSCEIEAESSQQWMHGVHSFYCFNISKKSLVEMTVCSYKKSILFSSPKVRAFILLLSLHGARYKWMEKWSSWTSLRLTR